MNLKEKLDELHGFNDNNHNNGYDNRIINHIIIEVNVNFYHDVTAFCTCRITHFYNEWIKTHIDDIGRIANWNVTKMFIDHSRHEVIYTLEIPNECEVTIMNGEIHFA